MIEIGKRYIRTAKNDDQTIVVVKTEEEAKYHTELAGNGFTYKEVVPTVVPGGTCVSCEG